MSCGKYAPATSSAALSASIAKLMGALNLEIADLPDDLQCAQCKCALKDAFQVPCGCRFCRACIDELAAGGAESCPGRSRECSETPLSIALPDYRANRSVARLVARCPREVCSHECPLADMEAHLRACPGEAAQCPFRELGCQHDELVADEMSAHMHRAGVGHSKILIGLVAAIRGELELLKRELARRDEQMGTMMDEMRHVQNENKSIKREKEALSARVEELSGKLEGAVTERDPQPSKDDIRSIRRDVQSMKSDIDFLKSQLQAAQVDASCDEWLIDADIGQVEWGRLAPKTSEIFTGAARPYRFRLAAAKDGKLLIRLLVLPGPTNSSLTWPFQGSVTVTVTDRDRPRARSRSTRHCVIEKPPDNDWTWSDVFLFPHADLRAAGLDLGRGVLMSCHVVPGAAP